ncbi:MAG: hypothetical protein CSA21_01625 [Deltaproteobacteria bacterium]|nr:MAG: hypothetical protein CSA21_01625 [Deltaproteobacteria bacterium]
MIGKVYCMAAGIVNTILGITIIEYEPYMARIFLNPDNFVSVRPEIGKLAISGWALVKHA